MSGALASIGTSPSGGSIIALVAVAPIGCAHAAQATPKLAASPAAHTSRDALDPRSP
ncbi:MAG: hypothetical protein U0638_06340 [Phycisphaerales bacterium]